MGNWILTIRGVGPHNNGKPADIERQAAQFVEQLKGSHTIVAASVTIGGEMNFEDPAYAYLKERVGG